VSPELEPFFGVLVAVLCGAAVGVERQRSGNAGGPAGGIRTFTLLGANAGIAGWLAGHDHALVAILLLAGAVGLLVIGYLRASKDDWESTTEVAAMVVLGTGVLAGIGELRLAAALTTLTVLLLAEKPRLHGLVARLDETTMLAAARFAVMSAVITPLLPDGPYGPAPGIRPRELWILVLLCSGISFVGFVAQRLAGTAGYPLTGLLGGLVSSTNVTLTFARLSKTHKAQAAALAAGAVAASTILFLRVIVIATALNSAMVSGLSWYVGPPFLAGVAAVALAWRSLRGSKSAPAETKNPLQFRAALEMAALFQIVLFGVHYVRQWVGEGGLLATGFVLGLTDVDALTLSMTRSISSGTAVDAACRAILMGVIANSLMKSGIAIVLGDRRFAWQTAASLAAMVAAGGAMLFLR
jgi:uncharacterized membrane protein (DUF4010 family)